MSRLPSLFVSHGAPTFALEPGLAGPRLTALGSALPRPEAVLVVSPHWTTPNPRVGLTAQPQTIHDFGGFDPALYRIDYPAPGHPRLAHNVVETLNAAGWRAPADERRGLDHGAWESSAPPLHAAGSQRMRSCSLSVVWPHGKPARPAAPSDCRRPSPQCAGDDAVRPSTRCRPLHHHEGVEASRRPGAAGCQAVAWVERQPGELPAAGPAGATAG